MKKTKTMKQKRQYCLKNNRKQKKENRKTEKQASIEAICAFPNWIFICLHVIRVSF